MVSEDDKAKSSSSGFNPMLLGLLIPRGQADKEYLGT